MSNNKPTILFFHLGESSFVKEDIKILQSSFNLKIFYFKPKKSKYKFFTLFQLLFTLSVQFFWILAHLPKSNAFYCWFADYHAFLPAFFSSLTKKPLFTVLGGTDSIKMPHLNYGIFMDPLRSKTSAYAINRTMLLFPVDRSLIETTAIAQNWPDAHPNGLKNNIKNFRTPFVVVPTGYDSKVWKIGPDTRNNIVSTVAACSTLQIAKRKGIDILIESAKLLPDFHFIIVGLTDSLVKIVKSEFNPSNNIEFIPPLERSKLNEIYCSTSVYLQLSKAEGLPNVLCEAMMCRCIPVGSPVFGIPHGIGKCGYIAETPDPELIASLIVKAHNADADLRNKCRNRIEQNFSLEKRKNTLLKEINSHLTLS